MEPSGQIPQNEDKIFSIKDFVLSFGAWCKYLKSKWLIILCACVAGGVLGVVYSTFKKPEYKAELTFVLEDSKSGGLGMYAGLASQFGFDLGLGGGSGVFSGDNIIEFLKSRLMVEKALLSPITGNAGDQSLADLYITSHELRESWKNPALRNIHFPPGKDRAAFSLQQDSILHEIYEKIVNKNLSVGKPDKKLSFIAVECVSRNELFSKVFTERLVKEATDFYVRTKTKRSQTTLDLLQKKADSIEFLLNKKTYSVAASQDLNLNPARNVAGVTTELIARDKIVLQTMYGEVVKNLELSRMSMAQETPIIQVVDVPTLPLEKTRFGKIKGLILGVFLSGFLIICVLVIRKMYREIITK